MAIPKSYEQSTIKKIQEQRAKTKLKQGLLDSQDENLLPNFEVWKYSSSQRLDTPYGNQPRYLSGTAQQVAIQASQLKALHDELALRLGYALTFEEWFEEWQKGFNKLINRAGSDATLTTNYPIQDTNQKQGWRNDPETRPQYLDWRLPKANRKFRVIEYFPEGRSNPENSIVLSGSDSQIINQILTYEWGAKDVGIESEDRLPGEVPKVQGFPILKLYFSELTQLVTPGKMPVRMILECRLMEKPKAETLTAQYLKQLATNIRPQFLPDGVRYQFNKGTAYYTYTNLDNGYRLKILARTEADFRDIATRFLAIRGHTFREEYVNFSQPLNESLKYPQTSKQALILGEQYQLPLRRKKTTVSFRWAKVYIPKVGKWVAIVSDEKRVKESDLVA